MLHHIELALSIADKGVADMECSTQFAYNVQAAIICYTLNVHGRKWEGEAADLGTVFQKGDLTSALTICTVLGSCDRASWT